jgi:feruloyl esterase
MARSMLLVLVAAAVLHTQAAHAATCESIASLALPNTHITSSTLVPAGTFRPPVDTGRAPARSYATLPPFCRVTAMLTPSRDSNIKIEVWLPEASTWNGRFQAVGNGGWAGAIVYNALANALAGGYATANTDTGHVGNTAAFAIGHPEKVIDLAYRAVHAMTVEAKAVVNAYYGRAPTLSLWNGCSFGGRQGITEALRYPSDFDAVIAGAPAVNWMNLHVGRTALNVRANQEPDAVIPPAKYPLIHDAALAACDGLDGVRDGVIGDPTSCHFDPSVLECRAGQDPASCLTAPQVASAKSLYAPVRDPVTGGELIPGLEPGSELSFGTLGGVTPVSTALDGERYIIHRDRNWDFHAFTLAGDLEAARRVDPDDALASASTNLKPFFARGGKLLIYHGFQDPQIPPENTIAYYDKVVSGSGKGLEGTQIALYMVPGMNHCAGGPGTDVFDKVAAMESWLSTRKAPASIAAAHYDTNGYLVRTRPLCRYPNVALWNGIGSTDEAANFSCVPPTSRASAPSGRTSARSPGRTRR